MREEHFDAIIVGGGLAGLAAGYRLASAGLSALVVERGETCGSKNVSGGRLYGHSMETLIPGFAGQAPVERRITREKLAMLTENGGTLIDYCSDSLKRAPSYTVIRGTFDRWLAEKAKKAGCMVITGIRVDNIIRREGRVCGITAEGESVFADVVVLADGVNSLLAQRAGMKQELAPFQVAVGAKEVIQLDERMINERFGVGPGEGAAMMAAGYMTGGNIGGGFLYTNKSTVSLGIVTTAGDIGRSEVAVSDMVDRFKNHPCIRPLIEGGKTVEYSAHLVPEGGYGMLPQLYGDGVLIAGDAAGFVLNLGYTVRGMDLAVESGRLAAETIIKAKKEGDFTSKVLAGYQEALENSFVMKELIQYRNFPAFMESSHRLYGDYQLMLDDILSQMYVVDGSEPDSLLVKAAKGLRRVGLLNLAADGIRGMEAL